jgi:hypothetical protein
VHDHTPHPKVTVRAATWYDFAFLNGFVLTPGIAHH